MNSNFEIFNRSLSKSLTDKVCLIKLDILENKNGNSKNSSGLRRRWFYPVK